MPLTPNFLLVITFELSTYLGHGILETNLCLLFINYNEQTSILNSYCSLSLKYNMTA